MDIPNEHTDLIDKTGENDFYQICNDIKNFTIMPAILLLSAVSNGLILDLIRHKTSNDNKMPYTTFLLGSYLFGLASSILLTACVRLMSLVKECCCCCNIPTRYA